MYLAQSDELLFFVFFVFFVFLFFFDLFGLTNFHKTQIIMITCLTGELIGRPAEPLKLTDRWVLGAIAKRMYNKTFKFS